jgi:hypothetical protein
VPGARAISPGKVQPDETARAALATAIAGDATAASAASAATGIDDVTILPKKGCEAAAGATPTAEAEIALPAPAAVNEARAVAATLENEELSPNTHPPSLGGAVPGLPANATNAYNCSPGETPTVPVTCVPPPPAPTVDAPLYPEPPLPPRTRICTDVTPAGTVKNCSCSDAENVTTTGDAADADELAAHKHTVATHISDPTDATARVATLPRPENRITNNPGFTARARPDTDRNHHRRARTHPRAEPPPDHPAAPNPDITCLNVLIGSPLAPRCSMPRPWSAASPAGPLDWIPLADPCGRASGSTIQREG